MSELIKEELIPEASISLKSDGIVYIKYRKDTILDIALQLRMLDLFKKITDSKLTPFIFEAEEGFVVTKEARDNAIVIEERTPCKAAAVVVENIGYAMIANFYMKFNKPKRPFKVFNSQKEAIEWLKSYV